jgi:lysophospholipase L1-like esterase
MQSGGKVTSWQDSSGNGNHIAGDASAPDYVALDGRKVVRCAANKYLSLPSSIAENSRSLSAFFVVRVPETNSTGTLFGPHDGFLGTLFLLNNNPANYTSFSQQSSIYAGQNRAIFGQIQGSADTKFYWDSEVTTHSVVANVNGTGGTLGAQTAGNAWSTFFPGDLEACFLYGKELSTGEIAQLRAYIHAEYGIGAPARFMVVEGDSISYGYNVAENRTFGWVPQCAKLGANPKFVNLAYSGQKMSQMLSRASSSVDWHYAANAQYSERVACVWGGTNDLSASEVTAEQLQTMWTNWCTGRQTAGYDVAVFTVLPSVFITGGNESARVAANTWLRANWSSIADYFVDVDSIAALQNTANTDYYLDGLHPTALGYQLIADAAADAGL